MKRREVWPVLGAGLAGCSRRTAVMDCAGLRGQSIRWVVPYPPGGGYDVLSRLMEKPFEKATGAEVVIANESGAGGLVGARRIAEARPDGRTVGVLNVPGLIVGALAGQPGCPSPARDFTLLGRLCRLRTVFATGRGSPVRTMEDLIARSVTKPLLFGVSGAVSNNLVSIIGAMSLLGLRYEIISGYNGSREELLGVMRGEVDLLSASHESIQSALAAGDLQPLFQLGPAETPDPAMRRFASLAGAGGWAAKRAHASGRDPSAAIAEAQDLAEGLSAGVMVAAPKGLPDSLAACLRARFTEATADPVFLESARTARRSIDSLDGEATQALALRVEAQLKRFVPMVQAAVGRMRR